jgi:flagellar motor switch protein FliG
MGCHYFCKLIDKLNVKGDRWVYTKYAEPMQEHELKRPILAKFEQILYLSNYIVHKTLKKFGIKTISTALANTTEDIMDKILKNVSAKSLPLIKEQMGVNTDPDDIKRAQKKIIVEAMKIAKAEPEILKD